MKSSRQKKIQVSVVVPAYNEEKTVGQMMADLLKCPTAEEIIVVNDGSTDQTEKILRSFGRQINLLTYSRNRGKAYALYRGIKAASGEVVIFLDADLTFLRDEHLRKLAQPILARKTNYTLGMIESNKLNKFWFRITGQRAYLKEPLRPYLEQIKNSRFGIEVFLNDIFPFKWGKKVSLGGLGFVPKYQKMPPSEALPAFIKMMLEVSKTRVELKIKQHRQLERLLNPKKIKSLKAFQEKINQIKDKEISALFREDVLPSLKKITSSPKKIYRLP